MTPPAGLRTNVKRACSRLIRIGGGPGGASGAGSASSNGVNDAVQSAAANLEAIAGEADGSGTNAAVPAAGELDGVSAGGVAPERWAVDSLNVSVATGILLHQLIASARSNGGGTTVPGADGLLSLGGAAAGPPPVEGTQLLAGTGLDTKI